MKKELAVHFHIFYLDHLDYYLNKLKNLRSIDCDIFVTMVEENKQLEDEIRKICNSVRFFIFPNLGYDVGPFIEILNNINLDDYSYILKLHTKRISKQYVRLNNLKLTTKKWVVNLVNPILYDKKQLNKVLDIFEANSSIVLQGGILTNKREYYQYLFSQINEVLNHINTKNPNEITFVPGTIFIARSCIFKSIQGKYSIRDFVLSDSSIKDRTLAHIFERVFGILAMQCGKVEVIPFSLFKRIKCKIM